MIEKMKFLSITGPKTDIDRVVNTYLSKYEIHLENALSELTAVESLSPFMEINPYKEALATANSFYEELKSPEQISVKPNGRRKGSGYSAQTPGGFSGAGPHTCGSGKPACRTG